MSKWFLRKTIRNFLLVCFSDCSFPLEILPISLIRFTHLRISISMEEGCIANWSSNMWDCFLGDSNIRQNSYLYSVLKHYLKKKKNLSFLHATSSIKYLEHPHIYTDLNKPVIFEHNISAEIWTAKWSDYGMVMNTTAIGMMCLQLQLVVTSL